MPFFTFFALTTLNTISPHTPSLCHHYWPELLLLQILICHEIGACRETGCQPADARQLCHAGSQSQKGMSSGLCEPLVNPWGGTFTDYRFRHRLRTVLPMCFIMAAYLLKQTPETHTSTISHVVAARLHPSYDSESLKKHLTIPQLYTLNSDSLLSAIDLSQTIGRVFPGNTVNTRKQFEITNPIVAAIRQVSAAVGGHTLYKLVAALPSNDTRDQTGLKCTRY